MRRKVLVIEDDRSSTRLAEYALSDADYDILLAHDGFAGMSKTISRFPDLIIVDVTLPRVNGDEICRWLRMNMTASMMPVIVASSRARMDGWEKACDYGADCMLQNQIDTSAVMGKGADPIPGAGCFDTYWPAHRELTAIAR